MDSIGLFAYTVIYPRMVCVFVRCQVFGTISLKKGSDDQSHYSYTVLRLMILVCSGMKGFAFFTPVQR